MRPIRTLFVYLGCLLLVSAGGALANANELSVEQLVERAGVLLPPADASGLTRERLASGLEVWIYPVPGSGEVSVGLAIRAGSLDESDDQRGAAYIAKRAAGLGTSNVTTEQLDQFRRQLGKPGLFIDASAGQHAYITHSGVVYTLVFDTGRVVGESSDWEIALAHVRDLLSGWQPDNDQIDAARELAKERMAITKPETIARRAFLEDIFAGERLGERALIPDDGSLSETRNPRVRDYILERYVPGAATLLIVGDIDPGIALARVQAGLGDIAARPTPPGVPAIAGPMDGGRISINQIDGYPGYEASLISIGPVGVGMADAFGAELLNQIAAELVSARLRNAVMLSDPDAGELKVVVTNAIRGVRIGEIACESGPEGLSAASMAAAKGLASILTSGFEDEEYLAARATILTDFEERASEWVPDAASIYDQVSNAARLGREWIDPRIAQQQAALKLAQTTDAQLFDVVRSVFDQRTLHGIVISPEPHEAVTIHAVEELLELAATRDEFDLPMLPDRLVEFGPGSKVEEVSHHGGVDVWTGMLGNGVVIRTRAMEDAERVFVRVAFAAGVIDEDGRTRGRTRDAMAAWAYPTCDTRGANVVKAWAAERGIEFSAEIDLQRAVLDLRGPSGSVTEVLELAASMIAHPGVDERFVGRVQTDAQETRPSLDALGQIMLPPGDPRGVNGLANDNIDPKLASAWLKFIAAAPIEVSIVGAFDPTEVLEHASGTLGAIPRRARPSESWRERWGSLPAGETTIRLRGDVEYTLGVVFADANELSIVRPMVIAARALDRYFKARHASGNIPGEAQVFLWLGDGIPDRVTLVVTYSDDSESIGDAVQIVEDTIKEFLVDDEAQVLLEVELKRVMISVTGAFKRPSFWSTRLAGLTMFGQSTEDIGDMPASYQEITPDAVRAALKHAMNTGVQKRVLAMPNGKTSGR
ncbi:MAG: insulinase family protein [Phycisphaerales bacterium]